MDMNKITGYYKTVENAFMGIFLDCGISPEIAIGLWYGLVFLVFVPILMRVKTLFLIAIFGGIAVYAAKYFQVF